MKEKILSFLKTLPKLQGVQDSYLLGVAELYSKTITDETQIATTLSDGVVDLLKFNAGLLQTEGDRRITQAKLDLKAWQKEHGLNEDGTPIKKETKTKKEGNEPDPEGIQKIIADAIAAAITPLQQKIEAQEQEKTTAQLTGKISAKLKEKGIPESYFKGRNLIAKSEAEIDQLVAAVETDYTGFKQEMAEQGVVISVPPQGGGFAKEGEALGKSIAEKKNTNSSDGVKGKAV